SIDSTLVLATRKIELPFENFGQTFRMLDHFAVHIGNVQSAVGTDCHLDGAEPDVAGANELGVFVDAVAAVGDAISDKMLAMDEIAADVGGERDHAVFFRP